MVVAIVVNLPAQSQNWYGTRLETQVFYKYKDYHYTKEHSKEWNRSYEKYNKAGQVIESGDYGEQYCEHHLATKAERKRAGSTGEIISAFYYVSHYDKLKSVSFYKLDTLGKMIYEEKWSYHDNQKKNLLNYYNCLYDSVGHLIIRSVYDKDSVYAGEETWSYDRMGNCIFHSDSMFEYNHSRETRQFDSLNRCIVEQHWTASRGTEYINHFYGVLGETVVTKNSDGIEISREIIKRNCRGELLECEERQPQYTNAFFKTVYTYSRNSGRLKEMRYYQTEELAMLYKYKYIRNRKYPH